jgi:hypothetical protein
MTDLELQYFEGCPNWGLAEARLKQAMEAEGAVGPIIYTKVETYEDAFRLRFIGSPTVLFSGIDPFQPKIVVPGLACRVFATEDGPKGSPTISQLRREL